MSENFSQKGHVLKEARESRGVSLEAVHEATKIPMDALRAIEEGYSIRTLSSFYLKGFIKMYAKYLGIDVSEVLEEVPQDKKKAEKVEPAKSYQLPEEIFKDKLQAFFTRKRKQQIVKVAGLLLAFFLVIKIFGIVGHWMSSKPKAKPVVKEQVSQKKAPEEPQKTQPAAQPSQASATATAKPAGSASNSAKKAIMLSVRADVNSWLQVRSDGNVVFQSTLKKGLTETWYADDRIEVSGNNIARLEFELNGKMIGFLGREDRRAKKVIVTQNGLSVEK